MRRLAVILVLAVAATAGASDAGWENPVFETAGAAVGAARSSLPTLDSDSPRALRLFVDLTLARGDVGGSHRSESFIREVVDGLLVTHPSSFADNDAQRQTIDHFRGEVPRQRRVVERRLARFGYPELPGLIWCRLVGSVDAFAGLGRSSSDRMSRVGGVTYYCRYVVLPLSYVGEDNLAELRRAAARDPTLDVDATTRRWQRESFASLVNTFRHELVHVHTNCALGVPAYADRASFPTWFHEGTATYLAADPHSGLSASYQEFQELFFYLAQRYGVRRLRSFYAAVLGGSDVATALAGVYGIDGTDQLFARSGRWHRTSDAVKTGLWITALVIVVSAFRGADRPHLGGLQVLLAVTLAFALVTGFADHLYGLRGAGVVAAVELALGAAAVVVGALGVRRIRRHRPRA